MKSIVFAILLYFVCASITCNKTEKNEAVNTVANISIIPSKNTTCYSLTVAAIFAERNYF